jgi:hypothetical protein
VDEDLQRHRSRAGIGVKLLDFTQRKLARLRMKTGRMDVTLGAGA